MFIDKAAHLPVFKMPTSGASQEWFVGYDGYSVRHDGDATQFTVQYYMMGGRNVTVHKDDLTGCLEYIETTSRGPRDAEMLQAYYAEHGDIFDSNAEAIKDFTRWHTDMSEAMKQKGMPKHAAYFALCALVTGFPYQ